MVAVQIRPWAGATGRGPAQAGAAPLSGFSRCRDHDGGATVPRVFQAGPPQALFNTDMVDNRIRTGPMSWDIAPDGKRFLIITTNPREHLPLT